MNNKNVPPNKVLNKAVMELTEPVLFRGMLQDSEGAYIWKLLEWNILDLSERINHIKLPFRIGFNAKSVHPQWEVDCSTKFMTLKELLACSESNEDDKQWYYFDYKHMQEWFKDNQDIIESLDWEKFGFSKNGFDSTLWIGTKGAHTNCHQDSYGCNLVAQIHGKKEWLLFPPSSGSLLKPTRIPYEESTIYSSFNFFSPTEEADSAVWKMEQKPRLIVLERGDVLLVPRGWWHYVESLDLSTSVNVWLPVAQDNEARVKEAITKLIVAKIGRKVCSASEDAQCSFTYCVDLLDAALNEHKRQNDKDTLNTKKMKTHSWTASELSREYPTYVKLIPELDDSELRNILRTKRHRFNVAITDLIQKDHPLETKKENCLPHKELIESLVNALCHPNVVDKVADLLVNR